MQTEKGSNIGFRSSRLSGFSGNIWNDQRTPKRWLITMATTCSIPARFLTAETCGVASPSDSSACWSSELGPMMQASISVAPPTKTSSMVTTWTSRRLPRSASPTGALSTYWIHDNHEPACLSLIINRYLRNNDQLMFADSLQRLATGNGTRAPTSALCTASSPASSRGLCATAAACRASRSEPGSATYAPASWTCATGGPIRRSFLAARGRCQEPSV